MRMLLVLCGWYRAQAAKRASNSSLKKISRRLEGWNNLAASM
jgi:hypothetical protein